MPLRRHRAQSVRDSDITEAADPLHPHFASGFDGSLFLLLVHGGVSVAWGAALAVFATGVVPIAWGISEYGQRHAGLTNVIVTGLATLATAYLKYTARRATEEYAAMRLYDGLPLRTWGWMHGLATTGIWPPLRWRQHKWKWVGWLLLFGGLAGHTASIVAILQPQPFFDHVHFDDATPCGVDPATLSLNSRFAVQDAMDQDAFTIGLQLGNYFALDQIAGNTTTAVPGRVFVKDTFGYGALGGLINGLQEVAGVEITAQCSSSHDVADRPSLWSTAFPDLPPETLGSNDTGTFVASVAADGSNAVFHSSVNSTSIVFNSTSIPPSSISIYAAVNASGNGAMVIADASVLTTSCTWVATPRLVHVEMRNFTAFAASAENATTVPAPVGRAVYVTVQGLAQAVRLGARLDATSSGYPTAADILQTLIADGLKAALTQYSVDCSSDETRCSAAGISVCNSHNRTVQLHWRFGDDHYLGILAIALNFVFGSYALWVVWRVRKRRRVKGIDPFKIVDGFKMGLDTSETQGERDMKGSWALHDGKLVARGEDWAVLEESVPLNPLVRNS
ncbi:hypothetical protein FB451DRAFT_1369659 [Mycena latifolia]|nr:hypothetical protein FB451DRAFT_1369659 [Mycena latifolia]